MIIPVDEPASLLSSLDGLLWPRQSDNQPNQQSPDPQPDGQSGDKTGADSDNQGPPKRPFQGQGNPASGNPQPESSPSSKAQDDADHEDSMNSSSFNLIIIGIIIIAALSAAIISYTCVRRLYNTRAKPKYLPGKWLKQKWTDWTATAYSQDLQSNNHPYGLRRSSDISYATEMANRSNAPGSRGTGGGVARTGTNASIRSVATLPAYSASARESERILGREGERAGVDVVLEYPETAEEEEGRREEEMASLHAIRVARRAEAAEREERRRMRREVRSQGGHSHSNSHGTSGGHGRSDSGQSASMLDVGESAVSSGPRSSDLITAHQTRDRTRRVSSVNYFDLGVARHDGTRVRANSSESDQRPLLDSAASISGQSRHMFNNSTTTVNTLNTLNTLPYDDAMRHSRGRSGSSALSIDTTVSDDVLSPPPPIASVSATTHGRSGSGSGGSASGAGTDFEFITHSQTHSRTDSHSPPGASPGSNAGPASASSGDLVDVPLHERPPLYEQHGFDSQTVPSYESPAHGPGEGPVSPLSSPDLGDETGRMRVPSITVTRTPSAAAAEAAAAAAAAATTNGQRASTQDRPS